MNKQMSLSFLHDEPKGAKTRKKAFLEQIAGTETVDFRAVGGFTVGKDLTGNLRFARWSFKLLCIYRN